MLEDSLVLFTTNTDWIFVVDVSAKHDTPCLFLRQHGETGPRRSDHRVNSLPQRAFVDEGRAITA